jgi:hypothetical protein
MSFLSSPSRTRGRLLQPLHREVPSHLLQQERARRAVPCWSEQCCSREPRHGGQHDDDHDETHRGGVAPDRFPDRVPHPVQHLSSDNVPLAGALLLKVGERAAVAVDGLAGADKERRHGVSIASPVLDGRRGCGTRPPASTCAPSPATPEGHRRGVQPRTGGCSPLRPRQDGGDCKD